MIRMGKELGIPTPYNEEQNVKFYEQDYYTPSDDGFKVFNTPFGNAKSGFYCNV